MTDCSEEWNSWNIDSRFSLRQLPPVFHLFSRMSFIFFLWLNAIGCSFANNFFDQGGIKKLEECADEDDMSLGVKYFTSDRIIIFTQEILFNKWFLHNLTSDL